LQVDGTTTAVNSTSVTVNEPIIRVGEVTSVRTVTQAASVGVSTLRLDSVVGINTGDSINGNPGLPGACNYYCIQYQ
jgi:RNA-binding protein YlmH